MSLNIAEIKQNDSSFKDNSPKGEIIPEFSVKNHKLFNAPKKILLISLLIFLIVTLFIFCSYLLLSHKSKTSPILEELKKQKQRSLRYIKYSPPNDLKTQTDNESSTKSLTNNEDNCYPVTGNEKNVLLISNYLSKNGNWQGGVSPDVLFNNLTQMNKINTYILDPYDPDLDIIGINYLKNFHLVAIDFVDGGYNLAPRCPNFVNALIQYIKEGGALFLLMTNSMILIVDL